MYFIDCITQFSFLDQIFPIAECMDNAREFGQDLVSRRRTPEEQAAITQLAQNAEIERIRFAELQTRLQRLPTLHDQFGPGLQTGAIVVVGLGIALIIIERVLYILS